MENKKMPKSPGRTFKVPPWAILQEWRERTAINPRYTKTQLAEDLNIALSNIRAVINGTRKVGPKKKLPKALIASPEPIAEPMNEQVNPSFRWSWT
jgi:hypothetical protein